MPYYPPSSPNITYIDFSAAYSLHNQNVVLNDLSSYKPGGAANVQGINFKIVAPSGVVLWNNTDYSSPDIDPSAPAAFTKGLSLFAGAVQYGTYIITQNVKDQDGTIYSLTKSTVLCQPPQNVGVTLGSDAAANVSLRFNCNTNNLIVIDNTNFVYNSIVANAPVSYSISLTDPNNLLTPSTSPYFQITPLYNGLYNVVVNDIATYAYGDSVTVTINYTQTIVQRANCIGLFNIECALQTLLDNYDSVKGTRAPQEKIYLQNIIEVTALIELAESQSASGNDGLSDTINKIEALTGVDCSCNCNINNPSFSQQPSQNQTQLEIVIIGTPFVSAITEVVGNVQTTTISYDIVSGLGASTLSELGDVSDTAPSDQQVLTWDAGTGKWIPEDITAIGGGDVTQETSGTQTLYNIPFWTGTAKELSKGETVFSYDITQHLLSTTNLLISGLAGTGNALIGVDDTGLVDALTFTDTGSTVYYDGVNVLDSAFLYNDGVNVAVNKSSSFIGKFDVKGTGATSATASFYAQNSSASHSFKVRDDGAIVIDTVPYIWPASQGSAITVLTNDGSGNLSWAAAGGGSTSPGGSNTQVQYNNSGSFGGSATFTLNTGTSTLVIPVNTYFGGATSSATPSNITINETAASGSNTSAGSTTFQLGLSTGNAASGDFIWKYSIPGSSGSTVQTGTEFLRFNGSTGKTTITGSNTSGSTTMFELKNSDSSQIIDFRNDGGIYQNTIIIYHQTGTTNQVSTFFGYSAGISASSTVNQNSGFGNSALASVTGVANSGFGHQSGASITSGQQNVCIGYFAGNSSLNSSTPLTTGSNNIFIGAQSGSSSASVADSIAIGATAQTTASNQIAIGGLSSNTFINQVKVQWTTTNNNSIYYRTSTPEGAQTGNRGDLCVVDDTSTGELYIKNTGTGNTGWKLVTHA